MSVNAAIGAFVQYRRDHSHQCRRRLATPTTNAIVMLVTLSFSPLGAGSQRCVPRDAGESLLWLCADGGGDTDARHDATREL